VKNKAYHTNSSKI